MFLHRGRLEAGAGFIGQMTVFAFHGGAPVGATHAFFHQMHIMRKFQVGFFNQRGLVILCNAHQRCAAGLAGHQHAQFERRMIAGEVGNRRQRGVGMPRFEIGMALGA